LPINQEERKVQKYKETKNLKQKERRKIKILKRNSEALRIQRYYRQGSIKLMEKVLNIKVDPVITLARDLLDFKERKALLS